MLSLGPPYCPDVLDDAGGRFEDDLVVALTGLAVATGRTEAEGRPAADAPKTEPMRELAVARGGLGTTWISPPLWKQYIRI